ncbi:hypothetical protein [Leuconostoc mesenteroides]|uniref:hypothetical protein n=1 Tax=Leuconostoc mesenteroides TaxID=1245 RepID=UPI0022E3DF5A|nr:hypothetical protein [Leuconostoc mesenteroides]
MKAKRYSTKFKSPIVALYNEGRSANSLDNEYHSSIGLIILRAVDNEKTLF